MRWIFILMFVANVVETLVSLAVFPGRVAIHFGADGLANGWAPNWVNALLMTSTHVLLFCMFFFSSRLVALAPARWVNLPNKDYWLRPANLPQTKNKVQYFMWQLGAVFFLFFFVLGLLVMHANFVTPVKLDLRVFFPALGVFLVYTIGWTIAFYRAFRIPGPTLEE